MRVFRVTLSIIAIAGLTVGIFMNDGWFGAAGAAAAKEAPVLRQPNFVTAVYNPIQQVLTLTGDTGNNNLSVTWKGGTVTVTGIGVTKIGNVGSTVESVSFHTGQNVAIVGNFSGGDDAIVFTSLSAPTITLNLGDGNDYARFVYCSIGTLSVFGGNGTDTISRSGTRTTHTTFSNDEIFLPPQ